MPRILSVWLPLWPIRRRTSCGVWRGEALRATVAEAHGLRRIEACSEQAAQLGVMSGQSLSQALAICPGLITDASDKATDKAALGDMARWCERISPLTAADPPDGLWIDITGCAHLLGGEAVLAKRLQQRLAPCRVAIADTAGAAWAIARATTRRDVEVIARNQQGAAIVALPVSLLRLDERVVSGLQRVGLRDVESILSLPRADLTARFGPSPGLQLDRALGHAAEPIIWQQRPNPWREHQPFAEPISTADNLAEALGRLSSQLCKRLEEAGIGGVRFAARFIRVDNKIEEIRLVTSRPLQKSAKLARLLADRLEQIDPGCGVEAMTLDAEEVSSLKHHQPTLDAEPISEDLAELIDTITNSHKVMRIWRPTQVASHVPERAIGAAAPFQVVRPWNAPPGLRPIRLISPPERIEAVAPTPDNPPLLFRWRKAVHRVRAASGPERIAAEWWRRSDSDERFRDYYRVEDQSGARFWLFRTSLPGEERPVRWYLHGVFG